MTRTLGPCLIFFIYSVLPNVCLSSLPTFNMHYLCGKRTEHTQWHVWKGGFLIFDSDLLPSDHELDCSVTLQVDAYPSYYSPGIVFSFSEWEMDFTDCDRNNLTIVDGDLDKNKFSRKDIQDLDTPICGGSQILNTVYVSTEPVITLVFKRKKSWWGDDRTKFNMTFMAYFEGSCDSYNNTFTCSNSRCIDKQFVCLGLNPCGDSSDCTGSLEAAITFWESIVNSIKDFSWFLVIAIGIYVVIKFLHIYRKRHGSFESLPIIGSLFKKYDSHSTSQGRAEGVLSSRSVDDSSRRHSVAMETRSLSELTVSSSSSSDEESPPDPPRSRRSSIVLNRNEANLTDTDPTAPPPSYHELSHTALSGEPELAPSAPPNEPELLPPPSYDEVMTNNEIYLKDD